MGETDVPQAGEEKRGGEVSAKRKSKTVEIIEVIFPPAIRDRSSNAICPGSAECFHRGSIDILNTILPAVVPGEAVGLWIDGKHVCDGKTLLAIRNSINGEISKRATIGNGDTSWERLLIEMAEVTRLDIDRLSVMEAERFNAFIDAENRRKTAKAKGMHHEIYSFADDLVARSKVYQTIPGIVNEYAKRKLKKSITKIEKQQLVDILRNQCHQSKWNFSDNQAKRNTR